MSSFADTHFRSALPAHDYQYKTLQTSTIEGGKVCVITFSRPDRFNALSPLAYKEWLFALNEVITGIGPYYSSGNELTSVQPEHLADIDHIRQIYEKNAKVQLLNDNLGDLSGSDLLVRARITRDLVKSMINFPKLLIAAVNGPALGFAVTTLALCDLVYTVKEAWFQTPFMQLGFCAEGCSSILFPAIMGPAKANEMLFVGRRFKAEELERLNFISEILPTDSFHAKAMGIACKIAKTLPPRAFVSTKRLIRHTDTVQQLEACNDREMNLLVARMASKECAELLRGFLERKLNAPRQSKI